MKQKLDCENRRLEHKVGILKDSNDFCECIIALYTFSVSKDQKISVVLSKLAKKNIESFDQLVSKLD